MSDAQWPHAGLPVCLSPLRCSLNTALLSTIFYSLSFYVSLCPISSSPVTSIPLKTSLLPNLGFQLDWPWFQFLKPNVHWISPPGCAARIAHLSLPPFLSWRTLCSYKPDACATPDSLLYFSLSINKHPLTLLP